MPRHTPIASDLEDPLALEQQVCFALSVAARNVVAVYKPLLEPMGLTHPKYLVMLALWQREPLSVRDLSRLLQLDPGTLSPLLKRLEHLGLLRRGRDPHDERVLAVTLTDKGRALRAEAEKVPAAVIAKLGMDVDELRSVHATLTRLIDAAQSALGAEPARATSGASRVDVGGHPDDPQRLSAES